MSHIDYSPALEEIGKDEAETFAKIAETFAQMDRKAAESEGRAMRASHAKSTGLLTGALTVDPRLPPELAQGLFASPARYDAVVRLAQGPGEVLDDRISTHRGMAVKLLSVPGERIAESPAGASQDWVLEAHSKAFINANATTFLVNLKGGVSNAPSLPQAVKSAVSSASRAANAALKAVGAESNMLGFFGHPSVHPLSEAYFSQAPLRWGRHIAKIGFYPTQATLDGLAETRVDPDGDFNAFRTAVVASFAASGADFEMRVQLATDLDKMPVEDASKEWPEDLSPYRRVALLTLPPQDAWSAARAAYFDERLSFQPANSVAAHRPLGQVMRARLFVYDKLAALRQRANGAARAEPASLSEVPD